MGHNIKNLKPNKNSRYKQGYIDQNDCKKYINSLRGEPIIYRSSLEYKFMMLCESSNQITKWGSEAFHIDYYDLVSKKTRKYNPDFIMLMNGKKYLVEIKPWSQTQKPKPDNEYAISAWHKNIQKWKAAQEWCTKNDWVFLIITEKFFETFKN